MFRMNPVSIIYQNDEILLINKPYGVSVQGGNGVAHPLDKELSKQVGYKVHLVHRLDRETSGLLVVAKSPQAASKWINLIGSGKAHKEYTAICFGVPVISGKEKISGTISAPVSQNGRTLNAVTHFTVKKSVDVCEPENPDNKLFKLSLVNLVLGTGRMHQIRIHLGQCQCPIAADDRHGNFMVNKLAQKICKIKKLCLVSSKIVIPLDGKDTVFEVRLPDHMQKVVDQYFGN